MAECEFFVKSWRKPDHVQHVLVESCSLTGKACFCESLYTTCTRRTFALEYDRRHPKHKPVDPIAAIICSEDGPRMGL
jgi:hypothetical protein